MSNVSVESKNGNYRIINKLTYPEAVNEQLFNEIAAKRLDGILPLEKQEKGNGIVLLCNVQGLTPLNAIFARPISKAIFYDVVSKLITQFKLCENNGMNPNNIDAAADRMFIDLSTGAFSFVYWPLVNNRAGNPPYRFLKELPNKVKFASEDDKKAINEYIEFFADMSVPFSVNGLQALVSKITGIQVQAEQTPFEADSSFGNSANPTPSEVMEYNPLSGNDFERTMSFGANANPEAVRKFEIPARYCTNCGKKNVHEFYFCTDCGTKLSPLPTQIEEPIIEQPIMQQPFTVDDLDSRTVSVEAAMLFGFGPKTVEPIIEEPQKPVSEYDPLAVQMAEPIPEPISEPVPEVYNTPAIEEEQVQTIGADSAISNAEHTWSPSYDFNDEPTMRPFTPPIVPMAEPVAEPIVEPIVEQPVVEKAIIEEPVTLAPVVEEPIQTRDYNVEDDYGSDKTVFLTNDDSEKTVLLPKTPKFVNQLFVYRLRTGEKSAVNKPNFCIGKERKNCDFTVTENNAVSRRHLIVTVRDGRYFVTPLTTTNGTFIDNKEIEPNREIEIFPEVRVRLADEEFVFFVEEVLA